MQTVKLHLLSDSMLLMELRHAHSSVQKARSEFQNQRNRISEGGWQMLRKKLEEAEGYLIACRQEIEQRKGAGKIDSHSKDKHHTVIKHANNPKLTAKTKNAVEKDGDYWEEKDGVPIIVIENGIPRRWRKGDPVY